MSAVHEYEYRQRRRRQEFLNRISSNTRRFLNRYQEVMQDMLNQGLDKVVPTEFQQLTQELNRLNSLLSSNPEEARDMSMSLGDEIYGLRRLAQKARHQVDRQQRHEKKVERQRQEEKAEQLWQKLKIEFTDPVVRDFALDDLLKLQKEYIDLPENELRLRVEKIKAGADHQAIAWKVEQRKASQRETQLELIEEQQQQVRKDLQECPNQLQAVLDNLQKSRDFLNQGGQLENSDLQQTLAAQIEQADEAVVDERCRQLTVRGIIDSLKQQGFQVQGPQIFRDEMRDEVVIQAKRLSGRSSKFSISLDGAFSYKFEHYEGMACKDDIDEILPKLQDVYGIELSNKKVIWENPDRNLRGARSMDVPRENENDG